MTQIVDPQLFISNWTVNKETGSLVVIGRYDANNNMKLEKNELPEIFIYDLKTLQLVIRI